MHSRDSPPPPPFHQFVGFFFDCQTHHTTLYRFSQRFVLIDGETTELSMQFPGRIDLPLLLNPRYDFLLCHSPLLQHGVRRTAAKGSWPQSNTRQLHLPISSCLRDHKSCYQFDLKNSGDAGPVLLNLPPPLEVIGSTPQPGFLRPEATRQLAKPFHRSRAPLTK